MNTRTPRTIQKMKKGILSEKEKYNLKKLSESVSKEQLVHNAVRNIKQYQEDNFEKDYDFLTEEDFTQGESK